MSILIKMEMPTNCCQCPVNMEVCKRGYKYLLTHPELYDKRADDCPLIEIPPHGDLIDRDAMYKAINDARKEDPLLADVYVDDYVIVSDWLRNAPTIIPASEEGESWISADLDTIIDCYSEAEEGE